MHRSQVFLLLWLAFLAGVAGGSFFAVSQSAVLAAILICVLAIAIFFRRGSKLLNPQLTGAAFLILFFLFGILRFNFTHARQHLLQEFAEAASELKTPGRKLTVELFGYVSGEPTARGDRQQFRLAVKYLQASGQIMNADESVLVTVGPYPTYRYGQTLHISGELLLPKNYPSAAGEPGFDYVNYLAKDGIFTVMYYPETTAAALPLGRAEQLKVSFYQAIFRFKAAFASAVNHSVAEPYAAYTNGILLGTRSQLPVSVKEDFARTSTSHILAISGYNIAIIAWVVSGFFLWWFRRPTAFWFSLGAIIIFVILTGAQASVIRAAVMGSMVLLAQRQGRLYSAANAIVLAGAVMVLWQPEILRYDIGFQLSFAGTLGLVYLGPHLEKYLAWAPEWFNLRETLQLTVAAQLFVLPLLLYYFHTLSVLALPANLVLLPAIPYTMLLGFMMGLAGLALPWLGQVIGYFVWLVGYLELGLIHWLAKPSWSALTVPFPWYLTVLAYCLIAYGLIYARKRHQRKTAQAAY